MAQKTFMCLQRSPASRPKEVPALSSAQMEEMYAKFNTWRETYANNIIDMGGKLAGPGKLATADAITDGPFVEAKEIIGGYMIVQAETIEEAARIAQASPGTGMPGSSVAVLEIKTQ